MTFEKWQIDSGHSGIHFSVRHMVVAKVRGKFARWNGGFVAEGGDLARAQVNVIIDASSVETGVEERDAHLKSADFLDITSFPEITFNSSSVEKQSDEKFRVTGDLTIRGVTREVVLEVEYAGRTKDPWGNERAGFTATTTIERKDFGLTWNQVLEAGGLVVGDRVSIELEVEAVQQSGVKAA